jgi:hypothetical protein
MLTSTVLLTVASRVLGVHPLVLAQSLYAIIGGTTAVLALVFVSRVCEGLAWPARRIRVAAIIAGLMFAFEGLYLRRTGLPDDDTITLLFIPLFILALFRLCRTRRRAWGGVLVPLFILLPLTHTLSTLIAALTGVALLAADFGRGINRRITVRYFGLIGGFWAYLLAYYFYAAPRLNLVVPYVSRVGDSPGLFLAWMIILVVGLIWFSNTSPGRQRLAFYLPVAVFFALPVVNMYTPIFPGTVSTPPLVLAFVLPLGVAAIFAGWGMPYYTRDIPIGAVLLALFAAPVAQILFGLTAELTPEQFGMVMRTQTFTHQAASILVALVVAKLAVPEHTREDGSRWRHRGRQLAIGVLLVSLMATTPVAYVDLDTGKFPSTTTESEFATATFAVHHLTGPWTSGHAMTRIAGNYYPAVNASVSPTATWVRDGSSPTCPAVSQRSWATHGVHLFPTAGEPLTRPTYRRMLLQRHVVYTASGRDPLVLSLSRESSPNNC